jgi:hypothetical protein
MDAAAADRRWRQAPLGIVAMRRVDIVDHQVERRSGPGLGRRLGSSDDDMRTAAQLEHGKLAPSYDRAQADRLEPACRGADIDDIEAHMAYGDGRPLIDRIGHRYLPACRD